MAHTCPQTIALLGPFPHNCKMEAKLINCTVLLQVNLNHQQFQSIYQERSKYEQILGLCSCILDLQFYVNLMQIRHGPRAPIKIPMQSVVWQSLTVASINVL